MAEAQRYAPESMRTAESRLMKQLEERFVAWANTRPDIRAAIVIGSRARMERPADEWSDLDIIIFTTSPRYYLSSVDWLENIGTPLLNYL
jgi:aminoglycoside 6-adenylyltransferase